MVLKIDGIKCKKVIDGFMKKLPKESIYKRIGLWFERKLNFIIWALIMICLLSLTVIGFTLLTTVCDNII